MNILIMLSTGGLQAEPFNECMRNQENILGAITLDTESTPRTDSGLVWGSGS